MSAASDMHCIAIPVHESDEVVLISASELPPEPEDLLELLKGELAPLHLWLEFAKAYLAKGQVDAFLHILSVGTGPEVDQHFAESKFERLQIHCALAAYHLSRAKVEVEREAKNEALSKANSHLSKAMTIDVNEQLPVLGLGQIALAKGDAAHAEQLFEKAAGMMSNGQSNISGLLALASLLFQQEKYRVALSMYRKALKEHPNCPPEVRLGIAACNFRLGSFQKAKAAYERVLQLNPDSCEAMLGLAVLSFNAPDADRGLREGMQMLCKAYNSNPLHPGVLNMLAHFSLLQGDVEKAKSLASTAFTTAGTDQVRAQSVTILARASHSAGAMADASRYYSQAYKLNSKAALPLLGLAQINLLQKENTNAISLLENALQYAPGWNDALMVLGNLYPQMEGRKGQAAVDHFKSAAAKSSSSGQVLEMLGELLATTDPAGSLAAYKKSIDLYKKEKAAVRSAKAKAKKRGKAHSKTPNGTLPADAASAGALAMDRVGEEAQQSQAVDELAVAAALEGGVEERAAGGDDADEDSLPAKLLNNAAALHLRGGEKQAALQLMYEAIEAAKQPGASGLAASNQITLGFNLARAKEAAGNLAEAAKEYKAILAEFPEYLDCYFRLAWIARSRKEYAEAQQWADKALEVKPKDANALALIGFLHMEKREWKEAEDTFRELRQDPSNKNDPYALMAQGAIPLNSLSANRKKEDPAKIDRLLTIALDNFRLVLKKDEHNLFAAHGVAAVLAEQATRADPSKLEYLVHAKKILDRVKDAAASMDPWVQLPDLAENLGHIALAEGRTKDAIQFYMSVQRRHHKGTSAQMLLYVARALYDEDGRRTASGLTTKPSLLPEARACILKAIHLDPSDPALRFNLAFVMQEWAVRNLKKARPDHDPNKALEFQAAVNDLAMAHRTFFYLRNLGARQKIGIDDSKLEKHLNFCHDTHQTAGQLLEKATREVAALEAKRQQSRIELEAALREQKRREEIAKAREARQAAERDEKAKQAQQRLAELQASWADNKAVEQAASEGDAIKADKRRKKKKQEDEVDAIFGGSDEDDGGDYDPNAPEESEYMDTGEPADKINAQRNRHKEALAGTGLESDEDEPPAAEEGGADHPPSSRGRLKRLRADADQVPEPASGLAELFGHSDEEDKQDEKGNGVDEDNSPPTKRRNVDLFGDSDED